MLLRRMEECVSEFAAAAMKSQTDQYMFVNSVRARSVFCPGRSTRGPFPGRRARAFPPVRRPPLPNLRFFGLRAPLLCLRLLSSPKAMLRENRGVRSRCTVQTSKMSIFLLKLQNKKDHLNAPFTKVHFKNRIHPFMEGFKQPRRELFKRTI